MLVEITSVGKGSPWYPNKCNIIDSILDIDESSRVEKGEGSFVCGKVMYSIELSNVSLYIAIFDCKVKKVSQYYLARKLAKQQKLNAALESLKKLKDFKYQKSTSKNSA